MFNVSEFSSEVNRLGVMKLNRFLIQLPMPLSLQSTNAYQDLADTNNVLSLYCEATNLPGIASIMEEVRRYGYGPNEKKPYVSNFTDVSLTFRGDAYGRVWSFLSSWMRCAINFENRDGVNTIDGPNSNQYVYEVGYKYDPKIGEGYATDTTISMFDDVGNVQLQLVLREAFPIYIGDIQLNWATRSDYMRIPVTLSFFDWYNNLVAVKSNANP